MFRPPQSAGYERARSTTVSLKISLVGVVASNANNTAPDTQVLDFSEKGPEQAQRELFWVRDIDFSPTS